MACGREPRVFGLFDTFGILVLLAFLFRNVLFPQAILTTVPFFNIFLTVMRFHLMHCISYQLSYWDSASGRM